MWPRALLIATATGAVYGLIGLEAASPLAVPLIIWVVAILVLAWRLPSDLRTIAAAAVVFVCGFGVVWTVALGSLLTRCKPPSCETADPMTDFLFAFALVAPLITLAGAELVLRRWLTTHRLWTRRRS